MGTLKGLCLIQWLLVVLSEWSRVQEFGIPKPSARSVHVAVFDPTINQFWIHGGSSDGVLPDLWSFDFDTGTWDRKQQLTQSPSPRMDHVAVWDSDDYALWLHGGYDGVSYSMTYGHTHHTHGQTSWSEALRHVVSMSLCGMHRTGPFGSTVDSATAA